MYDLGEKLMDEEEVRDGLAEGIGRAVANDCLIIALVMTLVRRGHLTRDDAATLPGLANTALDTIEELDEDVRTMAHAHLRGLSSSFVKLVTQH
jgi:hypothetical protein